MADIENNKAVKQCQDNNHAFYRFKERELFPKKIGLSESDREKLKSKHMVEGYKILQQSVKLRNVQYKNNKPTGDPPLEYPAIGQQVREKQRLRKMYNDLMMNTYLHDSDSDFDEHASVGSDKVRHYPGRYRQMMKKNHQS